MPESNARPESNAPPESTTTAAKRPKKSKSEKLGNQLTQWFIDKKMQNWQGFVDNLTDQEKMNISNLLRASQEKQVKIKSEEKTKTEEEVIYETFKDELKKQSEKGDVMLESEKGNGKKESGDGLPSTVKTRKIPDKQKPQVKKEPAFQQESNIKDVKKKRKRSIEADRPESPVIKIKQETDGKQRESQVEQKDEVLKHKKKKHKEAFDEYPKTEQIEVKEEFSKHKKKKSHKEAFTDSAQTEEVEVKEEGSKHKKKKSHKETIGESAQTVQVEVSNHRKKTHKEASAESPQTEQLEVSKHKKKPHKEASVESPQTEQFVHEKGDGIKCKNENQGKPAAKKKRFWLGSRPFLEVIKWEKKIKTQTLMVHLIAIMHKLVFWHPVPVKDVC